VNKSTDRTELIESTALVDSGSPQPFLNDECRLLDRYELQRELVSTLEQTANHRHLAYRVASCHHTFRHWRCEQNHNWAEAENSCSVRVCPHDSRRRSLILAGRLEKFLLGREKNSLRYAVFAERNTSSAQEGIELLWQAWTSLRRSVRWKKYVRGCIVAMEVTYNAEKKTFHPHLNVLLEGEFFPFEELNQAWVKATNGRGQTSFIRAADAGTVRELIKYVTKLADLLAHPKALDDFLTAVFRRRLVRTYGTFYAMKVDDEENPGVECPDCQTHTVVRLGRVPSHQIGLDPSGVLRVNRPPHRVDSDLRDAVRFKPSKPRPRGIVTGEVFRRVQEHWNKRQLSFEDRRADWFDAIGRIENVRADIAASQA
jgi:hypothetical protein